MAKRLEGRSAIVTGGGRGIGRAVALALAEEGANVLVCDLGGEVDGTGADPAPAAEVAEECRKLGVGGVPHAGDVVDFDAAEDMVRTCVDEFGRVDIVCNIAGILTIKMLWELSEEQWDRVLGVHLKGSFNLTRHAAPRMMEQRHGRIVNTASEAWAGLSSIAGYVTAKGALVSLTYATARELGRYGVTCNAIVPRAQTRFGPAIAAQQMGRGQEIPAEWLTPQPSRDAANFAPFLAYLASNAAADVNGCVFLTTGNAIGLFEEPRLRAHVSRDPETEGRWTFEEIEKLVPEKLLGGYTNPGPPEEELSDDYYNRMLLQWQQRLGLPS